MPKKKLRAAVNAEILRAMECEGLTRAELSRRLKSRPPTITAMLAPTRNLKLDTLEEVARVMGHEVVVTLRKREGWRDCPACDGTAGFND